MKPTAYLINVARARSLTRPHLLRCSLKDALPAQLDVFEHEPLPVDDPILVLDNVILTPHWSASTTDVFAATSGAMTTGVLRVATGHLPDNIVNCDVLTQRGFRAKLARFAENAAVLRR